MLYHNTIVSGEELSVTFLLPVLLLFFAGIIYFFSSIFFSLVSVVSSSCYLYFLGRYCKAEILE